MCLLMRCSHPGPTIRALELLQQERFRQEIINPGVMNMMQLEGQRNAVPGLK
jgi:mediator of RNA polymerase II transcription subunit 31